MRRCLALSALFWAKVLSSKLKVAGSNPAGVANKIKYLYQFSQVEYVAYVAAFFLLFSMAAFSSRQLHAT